MPGGGKSTVGRQIAKRLGWAFWDTDAAIEKRVGATIRVFFERDGETAFRQVETAVIDESTQLENAVIATGGGAVLSELNRLNLHSRCRVVYLRSSPEELFRRLRHDASRPLLQVSDPLDKLRELFAQRDPLYREVAHHIVETGRPSVSTLVNTVLMQLELSGAIDGSVSRSAVGPSPPDGTAGR